MKAKYKKLSKKILNTGKSIGKIAGKQIRARVNAIARQQKEYMKTGYDPYSTRF